MTAPEHVVFGTGAVGMATYEALRRRGESVRLVNRSGHAPVPDDVEVVGGDARDPGFTTAAASGARVVYQTLNPPYTEWTAQFPALQAGVLAAAQATGARLVSMENVYMYGRPAGRPLTEDRTYDAHTEKGRLRGRMARELLAAHQDGTRRSRHRPCLGLLRPAWRCPVEPGGSRVLRRAGRQDRQCPGRPRPAAHLQLHP